ncbi:hypothetical protein ACFSJU_19510 [Paradesertivirga mongoliensis]|uniref:Uncharacterized protein n=1 Tax=Paradesertivirga mongoliensis TaxID=2100740 RepID=A0ABW4ZR25_9SPHI|nr:hypothetical protein [Pedobacter mongoliensis]
MKPLKIITAGYLALFLSLSAYSQTSSRPDSIAKLNGLVTNFLYISNSYVDKPDKMVQGFILESLDSLGRTIWKSGIIAPLDADSGGYFVKAEIPLHITRFHANINCSLIYQNVGKEVSKSSRTGGGGLFGWGNAGRKSNAKIIIKPDTMSMRYGTTAGNIELELKSNPRGAETFLVPYRTWLSKIERPGGIIDYDTVERNWRVNGGLTDLPVYVDERVFMVVFKLNGRYKTLLHRTLPRAVSAKQPVFVNF